MPHENSAVRVYRPQDRFFDDLVILVASLSSFGLAGAFFLPGMQLGKPDPNNEMAFAGKPHVSNKTFLFRPIEVLSEIFADRWPSEVPCIVEAVSRPKQGPIAPLNAQVRIHNMHRLQIAAAEAAFIHYFETNRSSVPSPLPDVWKFARVLRNACAHGGRLEIRNTNAEPVKWLTLKYSAADNGKEIWMTDFTVVETLLLMGDMDAAF